MDNVVADHWFTNKNKPFIVLNNVNKLDVYLEKNE